MSEKVTIQVNGESREVPKGLNVAQLVAHLGLTANRLAIERNLEIVPRGQWGTTQVSGGDRFEIVHLVGGGHLEECVHAPAGGHNEGSASPQERSQECPQSTSPSGDGPVS